MARKIVITSGKGGAGKTTVTANLGLALAKKSLRVCLVDLDIGLNNLDIVMNVENKVVFDFVDVAEGRCRATQALVQNDVEPTLFVMPSRHKAKIQITADVVKKVVGKLDESFDYILIDCPAGIDIGFRRAVSVADETIVVVTPHLSGVRDATKTIELLSDKLANFVVVNRLRGDLVMNGEMLSQFEIFSLIGGTPLGVLPESDVINTCGVCYSEPYDILADNLHNGKHTMFDCINTYRGLFGKIKSKLRRNN